MLTIHMYGYIKQYSSKEEDENIDYNCDDVYDFLMSLNTKVRNHFLWISRYYVSGFLFLIVLSIILQIMCR